MLSHSIGSLCSRRQESMSQPCLQYRLDTTMAVYVHVAKSLSTPCLQYRLYTVSGVYIHRDKRLCTHDAYSIRSLLSQLEQSVHSFKVYVHCSKSLSSQHQESTLTVYVHCAMSLCPTAYGVYVPNIRSLCPTA